MAATDEGSVAEVSRKGDRGHRIAWWTAALCIVLGVISLGLATQVLSHETEHSVFLTGLLFVPVGTPALAMASVVVLRHRPGHAIGWLLLGLSVAGSLNAFLVYYSAYAILVQEGAAPLGHELGWINSVIAAFGIMLLATAVLLFPSGRVPSPRWRSLGWAIGAVVVLWMAGQFGGGFFNGPWPWVENPFILPGTLGSLSEGAFRLAVALAVVVLVAAVISLGQRYRRARGEERLQIKWFAFFGAVMAIVHSVLVVAPNVVGPLGPISAAVFITVIVTTILRYRLYDIDVVINKTFVYGTLALFIGGVYVAVVVGIGSVVAGRADNTMLTVIATTIIAVAFSPLRRRVQQLANRLVYGQRVTPYEALSHFSAEMGSAYPIADVLAEMAQVVAGGIGADRVDVWLRRGEALVAEASWPVDAGPPPLTPSISGESLESGGNGVVPVHDEGELSGAISYLKVRGDEPTPIERRLLSDFASQAGLLLRNARLAEELEERLSTIERRAGQLRRSRAHLVAAQDAARRALERDIHDGAQQHLVALIVKLGLARKLVDEKPEKAAQLLDEIDDDIEVAQETLHDLARGIYPDALTTAGVATALESETQRMTIPVTVTDQGIGRLPTGMEAAMYFSIMEALQNTVKYAAADTGTVSLGRKGDLVTFTVHDDGRGFDPGEVELGSGLANMEARLSAMNGTLEIDSAPGRGTTITGRIPAGAGAMDS